MEKDICKIAGDLLPLYVDNVCSEESKKMVEEHMAECAQCRMEYEQMKNNVKLPMNLDKEPLKRIKRKIWKKIFLSMLLVFIVLNVAAFGVLALAATTKMQYDKYRLADKVIVEYDENQKELYVIRKGITASAFKLFPDPFGNHNEEHMPYTDEDGKKHITYCVSLDMLWLTQLQYKILGYENYDEELESASFADERNLIWSEESDKDKVIDAVYYYDDEREYLLWENPDLQKQD